MKNLLILALLYIVIHAAFGEVLDEKLPYKGLKPKSCLEIKYINPNINTNGIYIIYDSKNAAYHAYCDFKSDAPFVWTLIESFDRNIGVYGSKLPNAWRFQRSYTVNAPYNENNPAHWSAFRMSLANMRTINSINTTTHWRATCNFNEYAQNLTKDIERNDYMRNNICDLNIVYLYSFGCHQFDYVIVRGNACVRCYFPFWASTSYHPTFLASHTTKYCGRYKFPGAVPSHQESDFGHYNGYSTKHTCSSYGSSTANWWLGGLYEPQTHTML
ncbi:uncharacterized protein TRIADDRAFT_62745 [Trichoplax adhaerens]|uniref:Fibrinogen C-terminal domain-containing protein n=1 Tax=Trichoplax adhaerens TaxID=10228 RepID=B3SER2_TRIAD|nr:predicted protein [Trichoplax adhaerens]EDV18783.1 predicted protein [Trichoplax adhaerens]|eukprot:XP_002118731.1 predicted protein [Trichoplax adhaerens]